MFFTVNRLSVSLQSMFVSPSVPNYAKDYQEIPEERQYSAIIERNGMHILTFYSLIEKKGHVLKSGSWPVSPSKSGFFVSFFEFDRHVVVPTCPDIFCVEHRTESHKMWARWKEIKKFILLSLIVLAKKVSYSNRINFALFLCTGHYCCNRKSWINT
jgi:hypothetical protein